MDLELQNCVDSLNDYFDLLIYGSEIPTFTEQINSYSIVFDYINKERREERQSEKVIDNMYKLCMDVFDKVINNVINNLDKVNGKVFVDKWICGWDWINQVIKLLYYTFMNIEFMVIERGSLKKNMYIMYKRRLFLPFIDQVNMFIVSRDDTIVKRVQDIFIENTQ
jgi:hypothetical protein